MERLAEAQADVSPEVHSRRSRYPARIALQLHKGQIAIPHRRLGSHRCLRIRKCCCTNLAKKVVVVTAVVRVGVELEEVKVVAAKVVEVMAVD